MTEGERRDSPAGDSPGSHDSAADDPAAGPRAVVLRVAYDGRPFSGFAAQRDQRTVQGELLGAVRAIDPAVEEVRGASRTDSGVHARDQPVAFDPVRELPLAAWLHEITRQLPPEIAIRRGTLADRGYAPRFRSVEKTYRYLVLGEKQRDPFLEGRAWRVEAVASDDALAKMRAELEPLVGTHDFAAFRSARDARESAVRTIVRTGLTVDPERPTLLRIDVTGTAFLYNMVRIIVGAVVDVGRGRLAPGAVARGLASLDRRSLGITAPPEGLYLERTVLREDLAAPVEDAL